MNGKEIVCIDTVEQLTELLDIPSKGHPLLAVIRLSEVGRVPFVGKPVQLNLYVIALKKGCGGNTLYGWRKYDFSKGMMNFFAPGQIHRWEGQVENVDLSGRMLVFHPDFIRKYPLGAGIAKYKFFSYETNEALHTSDEERKLIEGIMENIDMECSRNLDEHSQHIIVSQLEVLLSYAERFYTRQFRTRASVETDVLSRFESLLARHFEDDARQLASAGELASQMGMSTGYLNDLLRSLTGMNTQQHIHAFLIEKAKSLLLSTSLSVGEIAYKLGFEYPQYFNRLFKNKTGQTPLEFRNRN
ncbi:MAG: AraC family transcriptional regulator [Bacteroides sp.]|nr:AraC family transcriptional regulator [Bacteroides sp.]